MSIKSRKKVLQDLTKSSEDKLNSLVKTAAEEADQQAVDSSDYSDKVFNKLLDSIKIEGLED